MLVWYPGAGAILVPVAAVLVSVVVVVVVVPMPRAAAVVVVVQVGSSGPPTTGNHGDSGRTWPGAKWPLAAAEVAGLGVWWARVRAQVYTAYMWARYCVWW